MKQLIPILVVLLLPLGLLAQDPFGDDPFADPAPSTPTQPADDPFGTPQPEPQQPTNEPVAPADDPFGEPVTEDPFGESAPADDPFGSPGSGGPGNLPFGGGAVSAGLLDGLTDTLIQPLRPEFPWEKKSIQERPLLDTYNIREADVFWAKTVWREVDVREKMNHPWVNPNAPLMTVLLDVIKKDTSIKLYSFDPFVNGEFQDETNWQEVSEGLGSTRTIEVPSMDAEGNITTTTQTITDKFNVGAVKKFRIKEVWYFDKKHSQMKVAIMGIAPLREMTLADLGVADMNFNLDGGSGTEDPLFWIYYPDIREQLARYETYYALNDAIRMSWADLLDSRFFSSYIVKASNPLDKAVKDYTKSSLGALYESENIKEEIFNFEQDLWSY